MGIVTWVVWGLFVGLFARLLKPGRQRIGIVLTIVLGVVGSLIGGFVATEWLDIADFDDFDFGSFLIAVAPRCCCWRLRPRGPAAAGPQAQRARG